MHARLSRRTPFGFTLLELIVTVVVLGILAALAVPAFSAVVDRSKDETVTAELEALGRGVAALAAFDGELTTATAGEFVAAEGSAGEQVAASGRWTVFTGAPATGATAGEIVGELYIADDGGFLGAATVVPHDPARVAFLLVGASGGHAETTVLTDVADVTGTDALCFYGIGVKDDGTACTDQTEGAAASSVGGAVGTGSSSDTTPADEPTAGGAVSSRWAVSAGGTLSDGGEDVVVAADGSTYVTGLFHGTADFPGVASITSAGGQDAYVAKVSPAGTWEWAARAGSSGSDKGQGVAVDGDGNAYVVGYFNGTADFPGANSLTATATGGGDLFVAKISAAGVWQWAVAAGDTGYDEATGVAVDAVGNAVLTGRFAGTVGFSGAGQLTSAGSTDIFVASVSPTGAWRWAQRAGGTGPNSGRHVTVDANGDSVVTGYFEATADFPGAASVTSAGGADVFVAKISDAGAWQWTARAGGTLGDYPGSVTVDASGHAFVAGYFSGTADFPGVASVTSAGGNDPFVAKIGPTGTWQWAQRAGGAGADFGWGVAVDAAGDAFVGGDISGTADFPGAGTATSAGDTDAFVAKISSAGTWQWVQRAGSSGADAGWRMATDGGGNAVFTGNFRSGLNDPGVFGTVHLESSGDTDLFVAVWGPAGEQPGS